MGWQNKIVELEAGDTVGTGLTINNVNCDNTEIFTVPAGGTYSINIPEPTAEWGPVKIEAGDVYISDKEGVCVRLDRIEKVLGISSRNPALEKEYPDLREAGDRMDRAVEDFESTLLEAISSMAKAYDEFVDECKVMEKLKSNNGETD